MNPHRKKQSAFWFWVTLAAFLSFLTRNYTPSPMPPYTFSDFLYHLLGLMTSAYISAFLAMIVASVFERGEFGHFADIRNFIQKTKAPTSEFTPLIWLRIFWFLLLFLVFAWAQLRQVIEVLQK